MSSYEVHEMTPENVEYLQKWLDEHKPVQFVSDEPDEDDGYGAVRAMLWALPVGLACWAGLLWLVW